MVVGVDTLTVAVLQIFHRYVPLNYQEMAYKYYDQKVKRLEKLSKPMQEELLFDLINAFSLVKSAEDSAIFVQDLLTLAEVKMLSKRLRVAKLLLEGKKYEEIAKDLHVSRATIAKVGSWLAERGEGFKKVIRKLPEPEKIKSWEERSHWGRLAARYPRYFWPSYLSAEINKAAVQEQKKRLDKTLKGLDEKETVRRKIQEDADERYKEQHEQRKKKRQQQGRKRRKVVKKKKV